MKFFQKRFYIFVKIIIKNVGIWLRERYRYSLYYRQGKDGFQTHFTLDNVNRCLVKSFYNLQVRC